MRNCQVEGCNNNYHAKGYCQIHYDKAKYHGSVGDGCIVDHISHDKLDNRKSNLRLVTPSQNCMNKVIIKSNTSGVTGVYYNNNASKWAAQIWINGRSKNLGTFINKSDAITARNNAEIKYFGEHRYKGECLS